MLHDAAAKTKSVIFAGALFSIKPHFYFFAIIFNSIQVHTLNYLQIVIFVFVLHIEF
jgi:hypothetical protein